MTFQNLFGGCYDGLRVLVTGHSGFKGSWLSYWLERMGAEVIGVSLPPPTSPNHIDLLDLTIQNHVGDIRDAAKVREAFQATEPDMVFHMAAQPLVRASYRDPLETVSTNVLGTQNVYEACRHTPSVRALVSITSDKVYQNLESADGYVESDRLGGSDPYSCSKACVELLTSCYRDSFLHQSSDGRQPILTASVRAGNVIGGGDWAEDRIICDIVRATSKGEGTIIRNPVAVRPWQHVLEPLAGYLAVGQRLIDGDVSSAKAWNFGPDPEGMVSVGGLVERVASYWDKVRYEIQQDPNAPHETTILTLDSEMARRELKWRPVWNFDQTIERVSGWYQAYYETGQIQTAKDLESFIDDATKMNLPWTLAKETV